jgi:hypothetical protein
LGAGFEAIMSSLPTDPLESFPHRPFPWRALVFLGIGVLLIGGLLTRTREGDIPRLVQCQNNLRQIGLALLQYQQQYDSFPPAYVADAQGRPLSSWRVLILPYLDEQEVYDRFHLDEPWDSLHNIGVSDQFYLGALHCPEAAAPPAGFQKQFTSYVALTGPGTVFPGRVGVRRSQILDGADQTIALVETDQADIPWSAPIDLDPRTGRLTNTSETSVGPRTSHARGRQINVWLADGSVRRLTLDQLHKLLPAAATIAGGEAIVWPE